MALSPREIASAPPIQAFDGWLRLADGSGRKALTPMRLLHLVLQGARRRPARQAGGRLVPALSSEPGLRDLRDEAAGMPNLRLPVACQPQLSRRALGRRVARRLLAPAT